MIRSSGHADLPLHTGTVPRWLADRMMVMGTLITESLVENFGPDEVLVRLSDPMSDGQLSEIEALISEQVSLLKVSPEKQQLIDTLNYLLSERNKRCMILKD